MKLKNFVPLSFNEWQGLISFFLILVYCLLVVFLWHDRPGLPFLTPLPKLALALSLLTSAAIFQVFFSKNRRDEMQWSVASLGLAFTVFLSAGIVKNGYDIYISIFFWVFLNTAATTLRKPIHALLMASVSLLAYTIAHFLADSQKMPCIWWFPPLGGIGLILPTYAVLYRNYQTRYELREQRKTMTDTREIIEANETRLLGYAKKLEESNHNLQEFAYVISHDLREPLRTISAYTQLLNRRLPPENQTQEIKDFSHFIIDAAKRMDGQINGILEYSRVGRDDLKLEKFCFSEILDLAKANLGLQIFNSKAKIEVLGDLPEIHADKMQMTMLLQNLIGNAIKYQKADMLPHIKISSKQEENFCEITVSDNGLGIEPQYLESIFGVFRRLHTQKEIEGTGIGLSICRRIAQRHGGKIWATSVFGEGSAFHFTLLIG